MEKDYVLTLALTIYEDGLCSCGHPAAVAHHPDNDGWYDAKKTQCQACAALSRATQAPGKDQYVPAPGEKLLTVYTRPESKPLPGFSPPS